MHTPVRFDENLIAPCGMNCGTCLAYLRQKNHCPGCRILSDAKSVSVQRCIIVKCEHLAQTQSKFCYECANYPCRRVLQLDKRYRTKYNTSFIANLQMIRERGLAAFLAFEAQRRTCPSCGATLCVHRPFCLECKANVAPDAR